MPAPEVQKAQRRAKLAAAPHALHPAGFYDIHGREAVYLEVAEALRGILGEPLLKLIEHAQRLADQPDHDIHADLHEAFNSHIQGKWTIDRYDVPIEWYVQQMPEVKAGTVAFDPSDPHAFHKLPAAIRVAADAAMKRDKRPYHTTEWEEEAFNLFTTQGVSVLWHQAANDGAANSGAAVPAQKAWYNNGQAVIGVGDSSTAAAAGQFDLQAASNRLWVAMDASYPTLPTVGSSNQIVFRSTFGAAQAVYAWNEFGVANDNGSNVTIPGSAARSSANGTLLDRVVSAQGTKTNGPTWQPSLTLSIS